MYEIVQGKKFKSSYKRLIRSGKFNLGTFKDIVIYLQKGEQLPHKYHDHALAGNLQNKRECHIAGDTLLMYEVREEYKTIILSDIGNHSQLFES